MDIATGNAEQHSSTMSYDPALSPAVAAPGVREPPGAVQGAVRDTTGERQSQMAAGESAAAAAMSYGMNADGDRRGGYAASMAPLGASYGDQVAIPAVPDNALPAAGSDGYPFAGMEPTPADAGWNQG